MKRNEMTKKNKMVENENNESKLNSVLLKIISLLAIIISGNYGIMILLDFSFPSTNNNWFNIMLYIAVLLAVITIFLYIFLYALILSLMPVKQKKWITASMLFFIVCELALMEFMLRKAFII